MQDFDFQNFFIEFGRDILAILTIFLLLIFYIMLSYILTRIIRKNENVILDDISSAIKLFTRFFIAYLVVNTIIVYYDLGSEIPLLLTTLTLTIVSLSSIQIINNFLAGIVIILLKPYVINDFIKTGGFEGRVTRISLNYTKILTINDAFVLIPNRKILQTDLINMTIEQKAKKDNNSNLFEVRELLEQFSGKKVTRYGFNLALPLPNLSNTLKNLRKDCLDFKEKFGYVPEFFLLNLGYKVEYQFLVKSDNAEDVRTNIKDFRNKLLMSIYPK